MAEDSDLEKTEAPTPQKEEKAREEGQIPRSRELTSVLMMVAGLAILWMGGDAMAGRLARIVSQSLNFDYATIGDDTQMLRHVGSLLRQAASALIPIMLGAVLVALSAPLLLGGILFSTKSLKVDFKKLDPISGLKRLFSAQSLAELFKAILKSVMVGIISTLFLIHNWPKILHLVSEAPIAAMGDALELAVMCGFLIIMGLIPMVAFDVFWQVWSHIKKLRMSKQEIRDEHKQSEGDPHVKGRIRQQQRAIAQRRMMADVPKADVIVTNPTHYAVALRYDEKKMNAPRVLAKGAGEIALRIRELGAEHRVPILEAPPLARALFRHSEVGQHIPAALYAAVAEVLAWVYQLKRWKREGGLIPRKPKHLPVPDALDFAKENTTDG
ncbi:flagellar biosynthesis protein FlhB [Pectobacterium carotovorum]|uniref:Flagellar biosynthetic protein FlhB n=1 Tax=Pectobacterium carotovorum subsp. carotovorum TaxID=555 RepID=A0AAI9PFD8_PECCC|nr:flagellar biosynthesis protein FlhB [Pectobacterium carotovorum]KHT30118.1 flagellar biosynthesis protein FlhB [Pectobacterium carotovorum subsp. carotovorum]KHT34354.1 flagellar biosynthesis protein FlhB [Pectobacterium carotovorum subsp. carotovorum]MBB1525634.1 flagellar type III secretion system protein FlhB [Pectobacterium carotovorum subsp. carotovorum]MBL0867002.1 flagellar type III secretion system protein FlhB [Pectobacterium carotovorum]MBL0907761.1 flagellar type III secretion sy